jgi:hypothetical protein
MVQRLAATAVADQQSRPPGRIPPHNLEAAESPLEAMLVRRGAGRPPRIPSRRDVRVGRGNPGWHPNGTGGSAEDPGLGRARGLGPPAGGPA